MEINRMYKILLVFLVIFTANSTLARASDQIEISTLINDFFYHISEKDFIGASKLFHYPPSYAEEKINKDVKDVSIFLEALAYSFGQISEPTIYKGNSKIVSLQIGGGDIPYWKNNPEYLRIVFSVNFSKYGNGYVTLTICNLANKYEIREAKYGLDASVKNSTKLLQEAAGHIQLLFKNNQ
ncbi:MAG: hypothetical protein D3922_10065 [Candidatus Electrothrix sp. AR1]|nr:hypothetical protein [Candidatus Electrothrix sp. AR1]